MRVPLLVLAASTLATTQAASQATDSSTVCVTTPATHQIGDVAEDFSRVAEITGFLPAAPRLARRASSITVRQNCLSSTPPVWTTRVRRVGETNTAWETVPFSVLLVNRSGYADDRNDGTSWAGRGMTAEIRGGGAVHWGVLSASLAPVASYSQNREFDTIDRGTPGYSSWVHPWFPSGIDLPQRFGDEPFWMIDPGQSYVRLDVKGAALGASTENLWWGPGIRNAILLSNTAAGFPHVFLGTSQPIDIYIGRFGAEAVWGRLEESLFFDTWEGNDQRLFTGLVVSFEPRWLPGLFLGAARVYQNTIPPDGLPLGSYVPFFESPLKEHLGTPENPSGNSPDDQLASLFARWVLPESGFEVYAEWARNDHNRDLDDFIQEPDHSQAYTLGFQKAISTETRIVRLSGELTHLGQVRPHGGRATGSYYVHSEIRQGYTHRGQLLGAGIGPGSDSQYLGLDLLTERGMIGLYGERVRREEDAFWRLTDLTRNSNQHDVELTAGIHQLYFWRELDLEWSLAYSGRRGRNFEEGLRESNWRLGASVAWRPGSE